MTTATNDAKLLELARGMLRYQKSSLKFVREVLRVDPQPWQVKALKKWDKTRRMAIKAGHGVGKTGFESWVILHFLFTRAYPKVIATAPTKSQLIDNLWPEISKWMSDTVLLQYFEWQKTRIIMIQSPERWFASARTAAKPEGFAGIHEENVLMLFDEASGIKDEIYEVAEGALTTRGAKMLMCGNPTQPMGEFFDAFNKQRARYTTMSVSCMDEDVTMVDPSYADTMIKKYGRDSNIVRVRVFGLFPKAAPDVFIPLELVEAAIAHDVIDDDSELFGQPITIGVDISRMGDDETVIYYRVGAHVFEPITLTKQKTTEVTGRIAQLGSDLMKTYHRPDITVHLDMGAMGAGVHDELNEIVGDHMYPGDWSVVGHNFGGKSENEKCDDHATELYYNARELLPEIHMYDDDRTAAQLTTRKYRVTPKGKFKLESKDDYKKRHPEEGSPDRADGLVLCLAPAVQISHAIATPKEKPRTASLYKKRF